MIYELQAPSDLSPFPNIYAGLPPISLGFGLWFSATVAALVYSLLAKSTRSPRIAGIPVPLCFACAITTGLFINTYDLVDEATINLEHAYNLYHYGKFSMSSRDWTDGTVEAVFYLLHAPFARTQHSLILANYLISLVIALLHVPLVAYALGPASSPRVRTLQLCGFALCFPLASTFSSGFGNSLVSLIFLAAIGLAVNGSERKSLIVSGLLPLLRPDAILLSAANIGVVLILRWFAGKRFLSAREHAVAMLLPVLSAMLFYASYNLAFGHCVPTPVLFKSFRLSMLPLTDKKAALKQFLALTGGGTSAVAFTAMLMLALNFLCRRNRVARLLENQRIFTLALYALATRPLMAFFTIMQHTLGDFSPDTYSRYWIASDVTLQLFVLAAMSRVDLRWMQNEHRETETAASLRGNAALFGFLCLCLFFTLGSSRLRFLKQPGRAGSVFAGAFTQRYIPDDMTISTSEMNTFGLMIERPLIDLWGYTNPAIANSKVLNGDRIRCNADYFLQSKPDIYWPFWFTEDAFSDGREAHGGYENAESSLAGFHHTSKRGNLLGDMDRVLAEYDVLVIKTKWKQVGYLVRGSKSESLIKNLVDKGFTTLRQRPYDMALFRSLYDGQKLVTYECP